MIKMTAEIVSAYVSKSTIAVADLANLIRSTHAALIATKESTQPVAERPQPAVPVKKSVTPDAVICLDCGKPQKMLKRHVATSHGLTVDDYRAKWSLPADYPMVAPSYAEHRSQLAVKIGLGRKPKAQQTPSEARAAQEEPKPVAGKPQHRYPASKWSKPA